MTPEERQLIGGLFDRVRSAAGGQRDAEAEAFIADAVRQQPYAPYLLAQSVIVQEETLKAAAAKIEELEARVRDLEGNAKPGSFLGSIGKSILGGGQQSSARAPDSRWTRQGEPIGSSQGGYGGPGQGQPMQGGGAPWQGGAPGQGAAMQQGGGGFLKGALGAAAGVAGGMLLANSLSGLLGGANSPFGSNPAKAADLPKDDKSDFGDSTRWNENDRASAHNDSMGGNDNYETDTASGSDWGGGDDGGGDSSDI